MTGLTTYTNTGVIRAANLLILKKVWDSHNMKMEDFYATLGISRSTADSIIAGDDYAGKQWNTADCSKRTGVSQEVFDGLKLILIEGDSIKTIREIYYSLIENGEDQRTGLSEDKDFNRVELEKNKEMNISEYAYWKTILQEKESEKENIWQVSKNTLLHEVGKQVKEQNYNDVELWRFDKYIRKKEK